MGLKSFSVKSVDRNGDYAVITIKGDFKPSLPGQFYMLRGDWGMDPLLARPISVMDENPRTGLLRFLIKAVGRGTRLLIDMKPGEKIFALGPLGNPFPGPDEGSIPVLVGGGVGVPPLYHLAKQLVGGGTIPRFIEGARSESDLLLLDDFSGVNVSTVITTEDGSVGRKGMATDPLSDMIREEENNVTVYACGPTGMLKAVAEACRGITCYLSLEARMGCGYGACLGCVFPISRDGVRKYLRVCREGPVFRAGEVLWE